MEQNDILQNAKKASGTHQFQLNDSGSFYTMQLLPATTGLSIGLELIKMAAPVLGILADSSDEENTLISNDSTMFFEASTVLVSSMGDIDTVNLVKILLNELKFNGTEVVFDTHFRANYGELIAVLEVSLRENFGDFFTSYLKAKGLEIPTLGNLMKNKAAAPPESEEQ
jgi:hypothetical protein